MKTLVVRWYSLVLAAPKRLRLRRGDSRDTEEEVEEQGRPPRTASPTRSRRHHATPSQVTNSKK